MSQDWKSASAGDEAEAPEAGKIQAPGMLRPADPDCLMCFGTGYWSVTKDTVKHGRISVAERCNCTKVEVTA